MFIDNIEAGDPLLIEVSTSSTRPCVFTRVSVICLDRLYSENQ